MIEERSEIITAQLQEGIERIVELNNSEGLTEDQLRNLLGYLVKIAWAQGGEDAINLSATALAALLNDGFK